MHGQYTRRDQWTSIWEYCSCNCCAYVFYKVSTCLLVQSNEWLLLHHLHGVFSPSRRTCLYLDPQAHLTFTFPNLSHSDKWWQVGLGSDHSQTTTELITCSCSSDWHHSAMKHFLYIYWKRRILKRNSEEDRILIWQNLRTFLMSEAEPKSSLRQVQKSIAQRQKEKENNYQSSQ